MVVEIGYRVTGRVENIEIRSYPPMIVASVSGLTESEAFSCLVRYISGDNKSGERIPMTSPVFTEETIPGNVHFPLPHERHHPRPLPATGSTHPSCGPATPGSNPGILEGQRVSFLSFSFTSPALYQGLEGSSPGPAGEWIPSSFPDTEPASTGIVRDSPNHPVSFPAGSDEPAFPEDDMTAPGFTCFSGVPFRMSEFRVLDDPFPARGYFIVPDTDPLSGGAARSDHLHSPPASHAPQTPTMILAMPAGIPLERFPAPLDRRVKLQEYPGCEIAVVRFSGKTGRQSVREKIVHLMNVLSRHNYVARGKPFLMRYNPPVVPDSLRKNEVGIRIEAPQKT